MSNVVKNRAAAADARGWIDELSNLVATLAEEWEFAPIGPLDGGTESFVLGVSLTDATTAELKLLIPGAFDAADNEITVLQMADGEGCAELFGIIMR